MISTAESVVRASSSDSSFFSKSKSSRTAPVSSATTTVVTRVVTVKKPVQPQAFPPAPTNLKKRKVLDAPLLETAVRRPRMSSQFPPTARIKKPVQRLRSRTPVSTASSRHSSRAERTVSPVSSDCSRRSRSVTAFHHDVSLARECWIADDGTPGPGVLSCEVVIKDLMKAYKSYFRNPNDPEDRSFDPHPTDYPVVDLEYPNNGASERFILLVPKDKDHYNPILCLQQTLHTIIECYLTPQQQSLFGTIPSRNLVLLDTDDTPESSRASSPFRPDQTLSSLPTISALALFVKTLTAINALIRCLKYPPLSVDPFAPTLCWPKSTYAPTL